jgi:hypothetical protein
MSHLVMQLGSIVPPCPSFLRLSWISYRNSHQPVPVILPALQFSLASNTRNSADAARNTSLTRSYRPRRQSNSDCDICALHVGGRGSLQRDAGDREHHPTGDVSRPVAAKAKRVTEGERAESGRPGSSRVANNPMMLTSRPLRLFEFCDFGW